MDRYIGLTRVLFLFVSYVTSEEVRSARVDTFGEGG